MPDLVVTQETTADGSRVIALSGELDMPGIALLGPALAESLGPRARVVLDCTDLTWIDSSGLGTILGAQQALSRDGGGMAIACRNPTVLRVFDLAAIARVIPVAPTRAAALARVQTEVFEPPEG